MKVGVGGGGVLLVLLLVLVAAAGVWQLQESRTAAREQVMREHLVRARLDAAVVSADLAARLKLVEGFARRPSLESALVVGNRRAMASELRDLVSVEPSFHSAELIAADGRVSATYPAGSAEIGSDRSFRDYFRRSMMSEDPHLSDAYLVDAIDDTFDVAFSARVELSSGRPIGVIKAASRTDVSLLRSVRGSNGKEVQVFDARGTPVFGVAGGSLGSGLTHFGVGAALEGRAGVGEYEDPSGAGNVVGGYAPVPGTGWVVVSTEPDDRAFAMVKPLLLRLASVGALLLAVAGVVVLMVLRLIHRISAERNRSQAFLDSMAGGVIVTDAAHRIELMNPAMEELIGWSLDEVRERIAGDVTGFSAGSPEKTARELEVAFSALWRGETVSSSGAEHTMLCRDGRTIPVAWTAAPILEGDQITGIVSVIRDVSHEREIDQLKSSLVSTVSHELRTPLTMIQGFAELLLARDMAPDRRREAVEQIHAAAQRLSLLIDDLLAVSRIDSGRLKIHVEEVDVRSVLTQALGQFGSDERSRIRVELADDLPAVLADEQRMAQIVTNLFSNALKYSPPEAPVEVSAGVKSANVEVVVADHGVGLSAEESGQVFEKFFRADNRDIREVPGTGLGLYIAQNLAVMQGGRIRVESTPGRGSTFYLSMPRSHPEVEAVERERVEAS